MKPFIFTITNAITLIFMGSWGYFGSDNPSLTSLIPVAAGIVLLILSGGVRKANRNVAHIAVILTLVLLIALIKPLSGSISRHDAPALVRILVMMLTCILAITFYVRSFIDARKQRT
jgi:hypothetical protein